jgi:hypothetical protein
MGPGRLSSPITPMVRALMRSLVGAYIVQCLVVILAPPALGETILLNTLLIPDAVVSGFKFWTLVTYGWLHMTGPAPHLDILVLAGTAYGLYRLYRSPFGQREFFVFLIVCFVAITLVGALGFGAPMHLFGNLLVLYFFGHNFETRWGGQRFLAFWLICVLSGGVATTLVWLISPDLVGGAVLGASGGTVGLIAAFAVYFPNAQVAYGFVVPIKGKHLLLIAVVYDVLQLVTGSQVAVFAHFGGMLAGLALTTGYWRPGKMKKWLDKKRNVAAPTKKRHLSVVEDDDKDEPPRYLH